MITKEFISLISILLAFLTTMMVVYTWYMTKQRQSRYNYEKDKIELDFLRIKLERELYELNNRLSNNPSRFEEMNYFPLAGNHYTNYYELSKSTIELNKFLIDAGLTESDLQIIKKQVFVLTPFHPDFDKSFDVIRKVCSDTNYGCFRGDEQDFGSDIFPHILKFIVSSEIIIANITGRNPNVFYELGIAHALNKKVILIAEYDAELPVDLKSKRVLFYKDLHELSGKLPLELLKHK
ncbi:hypothetical protein ACT4ZU_13085 [Acinetobacter baumannii]|uniref:Uncharacterized protein n=1 Tax=Acinetobacter baumannii TaxID=470 RepID=A0AA44XUG0_ACIBA|nr:hypothetical protein [Acinetobacter baumannii]EKA68122.1 hypothetical protein ACINWC692_3292 [Acinetobacter baumannii WC-692]MDV7371167.1 hypothetical protein [Acinetobacter baumannii]PQL85018.1 hypothetical protein CV954_003290 [Acinetobacter baumannii]HAV5771564.1 hypothetical protein [Acinetobacter baumannii]